MSDKMRAEFDGYLLGNGFSNYSTSMSEHYGVYHSMDTDKLWELWKASRESLVVELPEATFETPSGDNALREDAVLQALESAGIKVVQK